MGKFLPPSEIFFLYTDRKIQSSSESSPNFMDKLDRSLIFLKELSPAQLSFFDKNFKLQVVERNDKFFALNSSHLSILRHLETIGVCRKVNISIVPITMIPETLIQMLESGGTCVTKPTPPTTNDRLASTPAVLVADNDEDRQEKDKPSYHELHDIDEEISMDSVQIYEWADNMEDEDSVDSNEEDDAILCAVCEQTFETKRELDNHRTKKRHYFCTVCEDIFSNPTQLQRHKDKTEHYSDDESTDCDGLHTEEHCCRVLQDLTHPQDFTEAESLL